MAVRSVSLARPSPSVRSGHFNAGLARVDAMTGYEFEDYVAELFRGTGYQAHPTRRTGDFGADVVVRKGADTAAVQTKCQSQPVGYTAVKDAHAARTFYRRKRAIVVTNNFFTRQAIAGAAELGVELWDRKRLADLMARIERRGSGLWCRSVHRSRPRALAATPGSPSVATRIARSVLIATVAAASCAALAGGLVLAASEIRLPQDCTVGIAGTNASIEIVGVGANQACSDVSSALGDRAASVSPSGDVVCTLTAGQLDVTVRDSGWFHFVGNDECDMLRAGAAKGSL